VGRIASSASGAKTARARCRSNRQRACRRATCS